MKKLSVILCISFAAFFAAFGQQPSATPVPIDKDLKPTATPIEKDPRATPTPLDKDDKGSPTPIEKDPRATPTPLDKGDKGTPTPIEKELKTTPTPTPVSPASLMELQTAYFRAQADEAAVRARFGMRMASQREMDAAVAKTAAAKKALDDAMANR